MIDTQRSKEVFSCLVGQLHGYLYLLFHTSATYHRDHSYCHNPFALLFPRMNPSFVILIFLLA